MENQNKNTTYVVLVIIVVVGIIWYFIPFDSFRSKLSKHPQNTQNTETTPSTPKFVMGVVSKTEGQKMFIKIAEEEKVFTIDNKTLITKQIKEGTKFNNIPAGFGEIKNSSRVVVYYTEESSTSEYKAVKIQILNL